MNVSLKFYDETKTLSLPIKFDDFLNLLVSLFGIPKENLSELLIFYHDIEGDKIIKRVKRILFFVFFAY